MRGCYDGACDRFSTYGRFDYTRLGGVVRYRASWGRQSDAREKSVKRSIAIAVLGLIAGCVAPMARMQPLQTAGQDVVYDNGTPVTASRSATADVIVAPVTTPTGRYEIGNRVAFVVMIRNRSANRFEVSEASFTLTANGIPARTVTAAEMEDTIRSDAAWARAANGFAGVLSSLRASATAGRSSATASDMRGNLVHVNAYDAGEAQRAQKEVAQEHTANAAAITAREQYASASLSRMLQRNTVQPSAEVGGFIVVDVPRAAACVKVTQRTVTFESPDAGPTVKLVTETDPVPCRFTLTANVAGETHAFSFDEAFSGG